MLEGYKTYVFSGLCLISTLLFAFGLIDQDVLITLLGIFGASGAVSMRAAVKKVAVNNK